MNKDRTVGEILEHPAHSEKLVVVMALGCDFCARRACGCMDELTGSCASNRRDDKKSVQFVPLRRHVEHKLLGDYDAAQQTLKSR